MEIKLMEGKDNMKLKCFVRETVWKSSQNGPEQVTHKNESLENKMYGYNEEALDESYRRTKSKHLRTLQNQSIHVNLMSN
jgi:hypothetical protein